MTDMPATDKPYRVVTQDNVMHSGHMSLQAAAIVAAEANARAKELGIDTTYTAVTKR